MNFIFINTSWNIIYLYKYERKNILYVNYRKNILYVNYNNLFDIYIIKLNINWKITIN